MNKITKNDLSKKLVKYGALSAAIIGVADASGQIIYTDVDPDFTAGISESYLLDLDNDGNDNFEIIQGGQNSAGTLGAVQLATLDGMSFVGFSSGYNYPSNLSEGDVIDGNSPFVTGTGTFNFLSCAYPNSQWCGGVVDGYFGVSIDVDGATHYGWARLDIEATGNSFVVKDYAYNSVADEPITAGDMGLSVQDQVFNGFNYFVDSASQLTLKANTPMQSVSIHNILGQQVISQRLANTNETINLSALKSGVYLATISIDGAKKTVKIAKK